MLKAAMFISAIALTSPSFAQDQSQAGDQTTKTAPAQNAPLQTQPAPATPAMDPSSPAPAETAAAPAAEATQVTDKTGIAQVVDTEFPTYDKNADSSLNRAEFGAWMVALKTASDPATKAADPAIKKWVDGAFASADTDKSKAVSKDELTKYLSQNAG